MHILVFNFNFLLYELFQLNVKASAIDNPKNPKLEKISKKNLNFSEKKYIKDYHYYYKDYQERCFIL